MVSSTGSSTGSSMVSSMGSSTGSNKKSSMNNFTLEEQRAVGAQVRAQVRDQNPIKIKLHLSLKK
jgi:hypothetical protein